ncbi:hypothetical protein HDU97_003308 [Phlyctochytrium planicorne]|nr:hypothetical protein HDU97_003308 [Phlyctochytrium planicorne]
MTAKVARDRKLKPFPYRKLPTLSVSFLELVPGPGTDLSDPLIEIAGYQSALAHPSQQQQQSQSQQNNSQNARTPNRARFEPYPITPANSRHNTNRNTIHRSSNPNQSPTPYMSSQETAAGEEQVATPNLRDHWDNAYEDEFALVFDEDLPDEIEMLHEAQGSGTLRKVSFPSPSTPVKHHQRFFPELEEDESYYQQAGPSRLRSTPTKRHRGLSHDASQESNPFVERRSTLEVTAGPDGLNVPDEDEALENAMGPVRDYVKKLRQRVLELSRANKGLRTALERQRAESLRRNKFCQRCERVI